VPYTFAHPAAVLPLARPMGRFAVPSALAIGSMVPDLWYFVPFVLRADSHSVAALLWFCLPAGLAAYALFHLLLKEPLIALLCPRLQVFTCAGLPAVPWRCVAASLLAGAITHVAWDALTHVEGHRWLQHASTALGTLVLAWWAWRKLREAPAATAPASLSARGRRWTILGLLGAMMIPALWAAGPWPILDPVALRHVLRTAGVAACQGFFAAILLYSALWQLRARRATSA
jgi:hypothetical protein